MTTNDTQPIHTMSRENWEGKVVPTKVAFASELPGGPYEVRLSSCRNVDLMYGQGNGTGYWDGSRPVRDHWVGPLDEIETAVSACRGTVKAHGLGAGNWSGGAIRVVATGEVVAKVSYNGRVWLPRERGDLNRVEILLDR